MGAGACARARWVPKEDGRRRRMAGKISGLRFTIEEPAAAFKEPESSSSWPGFL